MLCQGQPYKFYDEFQLSIINNFNYFVIKHETEKQHTFEHCQLIWDQNFAGNL